MVLASMALVSCRAPEVPTEPVLQLAQELVFAETDQETHEVDFGSEAARALLGEGWSWDESAADGTTFVWAVGEASTIELYTTGVGFSGVGGLELDLRCLAFRYPGAPEQTLTVSWDGTELGRMGLGAGFTDGTFQVPKDLLQPGRRRLTLTPAYAQEARAVLGGDDPRRLSFACDRLTLRGHRAPSEMPRAGDGTLWLPGATETSFYIETDPAWGDVYLEWDAAALRPGTVLDVVWQTDTAPGVDGRSDVRRRFEAGQEVVDLRKTQIPLPRLDPSQPARLAFRVSMTGEADERAGARLESPRLSHNGTGKVDAEMEAEPASPEPATTSDSLPPILLWVVDTLRADRLGHYGHDRPVSPNFDRVAAQSVVFDYAVAQSSWTRPTAATLLTGLGPERHGIFSVEHQLGADFVTLAEHLQKAGYATLGYSGNGNVSPDTGFDQGFDEFVYAVEDVDLLLERALAHLDGLASAEDPASVEDQRPVFLMIHSVEPHAAFAPKEPFRGRFAPEEEDPWFGSNEHIRALGDKKAPRDDEVVRRLFDLYDAEIAWNDHVFGVALSELEKRGMDPIVVMVADHGEAFRERGVFGHGWDLHGEVVRVPFWIRRPGWAPKRVTAPVQQADLLPTLLETLGLPPAGDVEGRSLLPWIEGGEEGESGDERLLVSTMDYEGRSGAALVRGRYKLIEPRSTDFASGRQLFDIVDDPAETRNLVLEKPVLAGRLARLLAGYLASVDGVEAATVEFDDETRRQLEALGYL